VCTSTSQGAIGQGFETKLNEVACKALDKMGFARVCGGAAGTVVQPVDTSAQEAALQEAFYIRTGSTVMLTTNQTTFVNIVGGGQLTSKGTAKDLAAVYQVVVIGQATAPGGSIVAKFGGKIALKNLCNGKFVGAENGGVKADRNADANDVAQFTITDYDNLGNADVRAACCVLREVRAAWGVCARGVCARGVCARVCAHSHACARTRVRAQYAVHACLMRPCNRASRTSAASP
jgi:hypothetical protein